MEAEVEEPVWGHACCHNLILSQSPEEFNPLLCCQCTCWGDVTSSEKSPGSTWHFARECWHVHTRQAPSSCGHTQPPWTVRSPQTVVPTHQADAHTCTSDHLCGGEWSPSTVVKLLTFIDTSQNPVEITQSWRGQRGFPKSKVMLPFTKDL